jgi:hypothetical protein
MSLTCGSNLARSYPLILPPLNLLRPFLPMSLTFVLYLELIVARQSFTVDAINHLLVDILLSSMVVPFVALLC